VDLGRHTRVTVVGIDGNRVRLGFTAPDELSIYRSELSSRRAGEAGRGPEAGGFGEELWELPLFLPVAQALRLEEAARERGLTAGQLARGLIREFLGAVEAREGSRALAMEGTQQPGPAASP
jgi:hypothetical protein